MSQTIPRDPDDSGLSARRERVIESFEEAWCQVECPEINDYLDPEAPDHKQLLIELVMADLEFRLQEHSQASVKDYLDRFPELSSNETDVRELSEWEQSLRHSIHPNLGSDTEVIERPTATMPADAGAANTTVAGSADSDGAGAFTLAAAGSSGAELELIEEIARGGMGVVYKGRQPGLDRIVAVKKILPGRVSQKDLARFRREADAAAKLLHPNIVAIHSVQEHEGQPCIVMEYVKGSSLRELVQKNPFSPVEAADYMATVAKAIHYAHQEGVLHRDLSPANVLIDETGQPKVTDFGLACFMESGSDLTMSGAVMGTPAYVPPEQAAGKKNNVGPASDVYSLGAVLYFLLTGRPPFLAATTLETLAQVTSKNSPVSPGALNPQVSKDLETICLKCLDKESARRYQTAGHLAEDLQRYLDHKPILARPVGRVECAIRWIKRNPRVAALSMFSIVALLLIAVGSIAVAVEMDSQRRKVTSLADSERKAKWAERAAMLAANERTARSLMQAGVLDCQSNRYRQGLARFAQAADLTRHHPEIQHAATNLLRHWSDDLDSTLVHDCEVLGFAFSPDASQLAVTCEDGSVGLWDVPAGRDPRFWQGHATGASLVEFNGDGRRLATGGYDGNVRVWNVADGHEIGSPLQHVGDVSGMSFLDDNVLVTASTRGPVKVWKISGVNIEFDYELPATGDGVFRMALDRGNRRLLASGHDGRLHLWNLDTRNPLPRSFTKHDRVVRCVALSPDGRWALSWSRDEPVRLWPLDSDEPYQEVAFADERRTNSLEFSADSQRFLVAGRNGMLRVCKPVRDSPPQVLYEHEHDDAINRARFSPGSNLVVTACEDHTALIHDIVQKRPAGEPIHHESSVRRAAFSRDGRYVATAETEKLVCLREVIAQGPRVRVQHEDEMVVVARRPGNQAESHVLTAGRDRAARLWNSAGDEISRLDFDDWVVCSAFSPAGDTFASGSYDGTVRIADARTGNVLCSLQHRPHGTDARPHDDQKQVDFFAVMALAFSHDGQTLATLTAGGSTRLWDVASGTLRKELPLPEGHALLTTTLAIQHGAEAPREPPGRVTARSVGIGGMSQSHCVVRFTRDEQRLLVCHWRQGVHLWRLSDSEASAERLAGPWGDNNTNWGTAVLSPDDRYIVTAGQDDPSGRVQLRFWLTTTGKEFGPPIPVRLLMHELAVSPDGARLAAAMTNGRVYLWDVAQRTMLSDPLIHSARTDVLCVRFSPDGQSLASAGSDGSARLWDAITGHSLGTSFQHDGAIVDLSFSADGRCLQTASADQSAAVWDLPRTKNLGIGNIMPWVESTTGMSWDEHLNRPHLISHNQWQTARAQLSR